MFQSAPDQLAGRCAPTATQATDIMCFNPRPTNWPGDAQYKSASDYRAKSFNPRPTNWPGDAESA